MNLLDEITIEDIYVKRRIPVLEETQSLSTLLKQMVKYNVSTTLIKGGDGILGFISIKNLAKFLIENIWELNIVINKLAIGDINILCERHVIFKPYDNIKDAIRYILTNKDSMLFKLDNKYYEVTPEDMIGLYLLWEDEFNNKPIETIMQKHLVKVPPNQSLVSTFNKYYEVGLDSAIITSIENRPVGIVTNTDYVYSYEEIASKILEIKPDKDVKLTIDTIMSNPVIFEFNDTPSSDALAKIVENDIGHLPIVNKNEELIGMIYKYNILEELVRIDETT